MVDGARPVTCAPVSASTFPLGTTVVKCTAAGTRLNSASGSFCITVRDQNRADHRRYKPGQRRGVYPESGGGSELRLRGQCLRRGHLRRASEQPSQFRYHKGGNEDFHRQCERRSQQHEPKPVTLKKAPTTLG